MKVCLFFFNFQKGVDQENFEDMIKSLIGDDVDMKKYLIEQLIEYCELDEATRWAEMLNIPDDELPQEVLSRCDQSNSK